MFKSMVVAAVLMATGAAMGQTVAPAKPDMTFPNGNTVSTLSTGEIWTVIRPQGFALAVQIMPGLPSTGVFQTAVVEDLPESDIVDGPQSAMVQITGDCASRTYTIEGTLPYSGKMRAGVPMVNLAIGGEDVVRRVIPGTLIEHVFSIVCR